MDAAVALVARVLEVDFSCVLELRAQSRTLLLRAGVGWREGSVGRTVVPAAPDTHAGYVLRSPGAVVVRSEEHTSELQSRLHLVCRLLLEKKKKKRKRTR